MLTSSGDWRTRSGIIACSAALLVTMTGCGTQLRSDEKEACAPGSDEWFEQVAGEAVLQAPPDATSVSRTGVNDCPRLPVIGVVGGESLVELQTRYTTGEAEEQGTIRLENAAGLADWSSFEGGGDCQVKVIDSVPSFLTVTSGEEPNSDATTFVVTARRGDPSICYSDATPNPGETASPTAGEVPAN